jgi:hypothetical protein
VTEVRAVGERSSSWAAVWASGEAPDDGCYSGAWDYGVSDGLYASMEHATNYARHLWRDALPGEKVGERVTPHPEGADPSVG